MTVRIDSPLFPTVSSGPSSFVVQHLIFVLAGGDMDRKRFAESLVVVFAVVLCVVTLSGAGQQQGRTTVELPARLTPPGPTL